MPLRLSSERKVMSAEAAAALVSDGDCVTISGSVTRGIPQRVLNALEVRFLTEGSPRRLTWFEPFPTGVPGIEPLSHPGLLKRVIGGWYTPHGRLRDMIVANEVEAYLYPLGSLSFWCQAMAAGRDHYLTRVGLETYMDPRNGGGRLNEAASEDIVSLTDVDGEPFIKYATLPISCALLRGSVVDEAGNVSIEHEDATMNVLAQALAAKRFGGKVIVQAHEVVPEGSIPARLVEIPGALVDAIVIAPEQKRDEGAVDLEWVSPWDRLTPPPAQVLASPEAEAWRRWLHEGVIDEGLAPPVRRLMPETIVARRAAMELSKGAVVNIGQGLPMRDILPVTIEEDIQRDCLLSIEGGHLGGVVNGLGFRSNTTAIMDTPGIFSLYGSALISAAFFSMIEFDAQGNVNLLRYGDTWVGPGGSMDIAQAVDTVTFCGAFRAVGLEAEGRGGELQIDNEGAVPRAVERVQAVCFNGPKMAREGKRVRYVTERAVFELGLEGVVLAEVAPGIDLQEDVLDRMEFRPRISKSLREMDSRLFTPGRIGIRDDWERGGPEALRPATVSGAVMAP